MERITGKSIADAFIGFLDKHGIPLTDMRGQGYDGGSNMSSSRAGSMYSHIPTMIDLQKRATVCLESMNSRLVPAPH